MSKFNLNTNIKIYVGLLLILSSCIDLEEEPYSFISSDVYYQTKEDAISAVNACYKSFIEGSGGYAMDFLYMVDNPIETCTNSRWGGYTGNWDYAAWSSSQTQIPVVWRMFYKAANRCASVIDNVQDIDMDEKLKKRIIGEAKFLRAHCYFNIVQLWGDAPLYKEEVADLSNLFDPRSSKVDIYNFIIEDLKYAAENCYKKAEYTESPDIGRVSSGAAKAYLGKVYLTMSGNPVNDESKLSLAKEILQEVVESNEYSLSENYIDIFDPEKKNGPEHMFSIQCANNLGYGFGNILGHNIPPAGYPEQTGVGAYSWGGESLEPEWVFQNFDTINDQRFKQGMITKYLSYGVTLKEYGKDFWTVYCRKYAIAKNVDVSWAGFPYDFCILRYADVLLMLSEVNNELKSSPDVETYYGINEVRQRAGIEPLTFGLTKEQFRDSMITERNKELFMEWHGWFDYVRKGVFVSRMNTIKEAGWGTYPSYYNVQEFHNLMPIPATELEANPNLEQNPGY